MIRKDAIMIRNHKRYPIRFDPIRFDYDTKKGSVYNRILLVLLVFYALLIPTLLPAIYSLTPRPGSKYKPLQAHGTQNGTQRTKNPIPDVEMGFLVVMDGPQGHISTL